MDHFLKIQTMSAPADIMTLTFNMRLMYMSPAMGEISMPPIEPNFPTTYCFRITEN